MPRIKRYQNDPPLPRDSLHKLTELKVDQGMVELTIDGIAYDVEDMTVKDMEIIYLQEIEQGKEALLCFEEVGDSRTYRYENGNWLLIAQGNGYIGERS